MKTLKNVRICLEDRILEDGFIVFDEIIREIGIGDPGDGIDMNEAILMPGFIDNHTHGGYGYDFMDMDVSRYQDYIKSLPKEGVTSFYATTMTEDLVLVENVNRMLSSIQQEKGKPELLGIHLEGPFISKTYKGAQREDVIIKPSIETFERLNINKTIKQVTLAPEEDEGYKLIQYLKSNHIVPSIGHTNASYEETSNAINNGAMCFTHAFNAMSKLHHRDIGAVGAFLLNDDVYTEIICDKLHVSEPAVKLLHKLKPIDKIILITDSMRAKGLKEGIYDLGGQEVHYHNNAARLKDGTLAGSTLTMINAVKNFKEITNCSLIDLVKVSSSNIATMHNIDQQKGFIKEGYDADFVLLSDELELKSIYKKGMKTPIQ